MTCFTGKGLYPDKAFKAKRGSNNTQGKMRSDLGFTQNYLD